MAWEVIEHKSAPSSNVFDFTSLDLSSYNRVQVLLDGLDVGTDGTWFHLQLATASTLRTSGYRWRTENHTTGSTTTTAANSAASGFIRILGADSGFSMGNAAGESGSIRVEIGNVTAALYKHVQSQAIYTGASGNAGLHIGGGILEQTGAVDRILIKPVIASSGLDGTVSAGTATLYGLRTS